MTNSEKYLKDGVDVEFVDEFEKFCAKQTGNQASSVRLIQFLSRAVTPTLKEDERVILRNLRYEKGAYEYTKIGRTELDSEGRCDLILIDSDNESVWWGEYGHLFQFIKNGEEYSIKELLKGE